MAPRILILASSVGAGHIRAAQAIEWAAKQLVPEATILNVDVLSLSNRLFRWVYADSYIYMVNHLPHVYGHFYEQFEKSDAKGKNFIDAWRLRYESWNLGKLIRLLCKDPWDLILNTHFLPAEMVARLKMLGKIQTPHVNTVTDFEPHRMWVTQPCERYFVATQEGAQYLNFRGVPRNDIAITGIPIHPEFARKKKREEYLQKHELRRDRKVVLQLSGGFGVGPVETIARSLLSMSIPIQLVVVAGKNTALKQRLESLSIPQHQCLKIYGFTHEMDELMATADVIVSKPGGLTTSEALARGAAMTVLDPTPGQETHNCDYLLENGAAIRVSHPCMLAEKVGDLIADTERLQRMRENAERLGKPRAAFEIVQQALRLIR